MPEQLVSFDKAIWHDHSGLLQTHISVGMAGRLHEHVPPEDQLWSTARVTAWLMEYFSNVKRQMVRGHTYWAAKADQYTVCPGWHKAGWKEDWEAALQEALEARMPEQ